MNSAVYAGESSENYVDTRVRIHKNFKKSMTLPPDPDLVEFATKRAPFKTFKWLRCC